MKWYNYKLKFTKVAQSEGKSLSYIKSCLKYAELLNKNQVPIIYNNLHLSLLLGVNIQFLYKVSNASDKFYRTFFVPKKDSSKKRKIQEPLPTLKSSQIWILNNILKKIKVHPCAKAYIGGSSIKDAAKFHINQKYLVKIDIKNFFPNITFEMTYGIFRHCGYNKHLSVLLAKCCCLNDKLPQGAPTSPTISNIILKNVDSILFDYSLENKIRYTRYADDLIFSGDFDINALIKYVSNVLRFYGFQVNNEKTKILSSGQRQIVTGVLVNKKLNAPKEMRKKLRQEIYYIKKFGIENHIEKTNTESIFYINKLMGTVSHILYLNPKDEEARTYKDFLQTLT